MNEALLSLHGRLNGLGVDAALFNTSEAATSPNVRYLTGFTGSQGALVVTETERHFFTDGRYKSQAHEQVSGVRIHIVRRKIDAIARILKRFRVKRLGIESQRVTYEFCRLLLRRVPGLDVVPLGHAFLENYRIQKSSDERSILAEAARIASESCRSVLEAGLEGRAERDAAGELEALFRRNGADGIAFDTIVASGPRSALPHGVASGRVIGEGELIVIDYGCRHDGYHSDETVTCVTGKASTDQRRMHTAVYDAHMRAIEASKPGVKVRDVDAAARGSIADAGFGAYFIHGLGHGVGLEVHEPPYLSPMGRGILKEGMVFTIEPGIYIEGTGGVRLESLVYMAHDGPEVLSAMPKELIPVQ